MKRVYSPAQVYEPIKRDMEELGKTMHTLGGKHYGETAYIIGNGPSMKDFDFSRLKGKLTFAVNDGRLFFDKLKPTYWVVHDAWYTHHYHDLLSEYDGNLMLNASNFSVTAKIPSKYIKNAYYAPNVALYYDDGRRMAGFSPDSDIEVISGGSVIVNVLQMAWYMGVRRFILVGVDHNLRRYEEKGEHFSREYCDRKPELRTYRDLEIINTAFRMAGEFIASNGGEVISANESTGLTYFPVRSFDEVEKTENSLKL